MRRRSARKRMPIWRMTRTSSNETRRQIAAANPTGSPVVNHASRPGITKATLIAWTLRWRACGNNPFQDRTIRCLLPRTNRFKVANHDCRSPIESAHTIGLCNGKSQVAQRILLIRKDDQTGALRAVRQLAGRSAVLHEPDFGSVEFVVVVDRVSARQGDLLHDPDLCAGQFVVNRDRPRAPQGGSRNKKQHAQRVGTSHLSRRLNKFQDHWP